MADIKEKLVELLDGVQDSGIIEIPAGLGCTREYITNEKVADALISHGVTVQASNPIDSDGVSRWIPVTERLPELCVPVIVCRDDGKVEQGVYFTSNGWWKVFGARTKRVTHWMPLPQPPKEGA